MAFRAFIAAEIVGTEQMRQFHNELCKVGRGLKPVDIDMVHITLKFLGDTDEKLVPEIEKVMISAVQGIQPFDVTLKGSGAFPNRGPAKVVWVGMEGAEALGVIAEKLEDGLEKFGFPKEGRGFQPHVTLARVKEPSAAFAAKYAADLYKDKDFGRQTISEILLKRSVLSRFGPEYSTELSVKLH